MKRKQKPQPQKDILEEFTVQGSNISPKNGHVEDEDVLFPRWDMLDLPGGYIVL